MDLLENETWSVKSGERRALHRPHFLNTVGRILDNEGLPVSYKSPSTGRVVKNGYNELHMQFGCYKDQMITES
jgi:hypothetical protein